MNASDDDKLKTVGEVIKALNKVGLSPVLVGGMALVALGSRRITKDFDFVASKSTQDMRATSDVLYDHGLELVTKMDKEGNILATLDNKNIAKARLEMDAPDNAFFFNVKTGLRIDFLFDFPMKSEELFEDSNHVKIDGYDFHIASKKHLIQLKEMAAEDRGKPSDFSDLEFLKNLTES